MATYELDNMCCKVKAGDYGGLESWQAPVPTLCLGIFQGGDTGMRQFFPPALVIPFSAFPEKPAELGA
jgi:hypothetical protein